MMGSEAEESGGRWPLWLKPLLSTQFFKQCKLHVHSHKTECNMFCLDCINGPLCSLCLSFHHHDHRTIQIRRSSYHDVIRVSEAQNILDISDVQTYVINSARVVFLNERPLPRPGKPLTNTCEICFRTLLDSFRFCSLGCKIAGTSKDFRRRGKNQKTAEGSDSEGSSITGMKSFSPSTPPATCLSFRTHKRRKGVPHRAPLGTLTAEHLF
ncbi:PLATZ transcription factor family protein [Wolffia australiana]